MGQDCIIKIDNKYCHLDRFYVFKNEFEFEIEYKSNKYKNKINKLKLNAKKITNKNDKSYYLSWINILEKLIKKYKPKLIIFYDDGNAPEEYYNNKNNKIQLSNVLCI